MAKSFCATVVYRIGGKAANDCRAVAQRRAAPALKGDVQRCQDEVSANYSDLRAAEIAFAAVSYQELFFRSAERRSFLEVDRFAFEELTCFFVSTLTSMRMAISQPRIFTSSRPNTQSSVNKDSVVKPRHCDALLVDARRPFAHQAARSRDLIFGHILRNQITRRGSFRISS